MNGIKELFKPGKLVTAPGIFDGISARIADPFAGVYMTGCKDSCFAFGHAGRRDR